MENLELYTCIILKYSSIIFIIFGGVAMICSFIIHESPKTDFIILLYGPAYFLPGIGMFYAMRHSHWEMYMLSWICWFSSFIYLSLFEIPSPKGKIAKTILTIGKSSTFDITGKARLKND